MKKFCCLVFTMLLVFSMLSTSLAKETEYDQMPIEELIEIRHQVEAAISNKQAIEGEIELVPGIYIVGKDFEPGTYIIRFIRSIGIATVFETEKDYNIMKSLSDEEFNSYSYQVLDSNTQIRIILEDGNVLSLFQAGLYTIKKAQPIF